MTLLDAAARGGAVALFLLLAALLWRDGRRVPAGWAACLLTLGAAAYVIESAPPIAALSVAEAPWLVPLRLLSMSTPALFWLYSTTCFDDEFRPSWWLALPWLGAVIVATLCLLIGTRVLWWIYSALSLVYVGLAVWQAAIGRSTDLIEPRRRFRMVMIGLVGVYVVVLVIANLRQDRVDSPSPGPTSRTFESYGLLFLAALLTMTRLTLRRTPEMAALGVSASAEPSLAAATAVTPVEPPPPEPADTALLTQLTRLMERERCYREDGFSIATLAGRMSIPEYRLRRLINQQLGHRNFTTFVNGYRLAEAEAALADAAQDDVPILTIALDTGFQSIGPFNRAFKARTGLTPSEFRRARGRPIA
jgi:AraC-like DNA-binding protein